MRISTCKYMRYKMHIARDSDQCSLCNSALETLAHIFLYCPYSKVFTDRLNKFITDNIFKDFRDTKRYYFITCNHVNSIVNYLNITAKWYMSKKIQTAKPLICFYLTLILLRLFQQHYCYNVTGQSQESEGSCKPARIKEVHSKLHSFQASLCSPTATHLTLIYVCTYIRLSVPLGCLIKQTGIIIHTILNMWETPGIEPATSDLTSVYKISSSTN